MSDDELGRGLVGLVPDPAPGYWTAIDSVLEQVLPEGAGRPGQPWSRILLVAAVIAVALAVAGGLLAARGPADQIANGPDVTAPGTTEDSPPPDSSGPGATDPASAGADRAPTGTVVVGGAPLAPYPNERSVTDAGSDPAFGSVAPSITGTDFDGAERTIQPDGRRKAVVFVASWCPHCQPLLETISRMVQEQRVPDDLDLYVVSTQYQAEAGNPPQSWPILDELRGHGVRILRDDENDRALTAYASGGFPYVAYLDGGNRVVARSAGELDAATLAELFSRTA